MFWEKYIGGTLVLLLLIFSYPYVNTELQNGNFTSTTLGVAAGIIVPLLLIIAIIVLACVLLIVAVKDIQKG